MVNPFGALGNIGNIMKQAKGMQEKVKQIQDELAVTQVVGEAGAGMVKLTINGNGEALHISIEDAVYQEDKRILQGLIIAAVNDANHKRETLKKDKMTTMMTSMGLPADFELPPGS
jgi:DNA-binding YbaB/EbfC family protein